MAGHQQQKASAAGLVAVALGGGNQLAKPQRRLGVFGRSFSRTLPFSKEGVDIPHCGQNSDDFNAVLNWQVENQIIAKRETS
jgi:hypothetical protein